jgi:hypothetical protein
MAVRISPRVAWQAVADEVIVVDVSTRRVLGLNATGSLVWQLVASGVQEDLAGAVAERFGVPRADAEEDVSQFLGALRGRGLLEVEE